MPKLKITYLPVGDILPRENSQRQQPAGIEALKDSIKRIGLLHPIVVDDEQRLVAGGNRLEAYKQLAAESNEWATIPTIKKSDLSETERRVIELEENMKRSNLKWQEEALAVVELDTLLIEDGKKLMDDRAAYVGISPKWYGKWLACGRAIKAGHTRVLEAPTMSAACNILDRERTRTQDNEMNELFEQITAVQSEGDDTQEELPFDADPLDLPDSLQPQGQGKPTAKTTKQVVFNTDFITWANEYSGPKFNLIHCDFPYGINHGKSDQGGAKNRWDSYNDSPDVYFALIRALLSNRDKIMLPSCHMIFWLSARYSMEEITRKMFSELAPDLDVDEYALIWHNKGIIRDVEHTPRHIYEKALFITRGNRHIIKAIGDVYGAPTRKADALHISEKPVPVLRHFMQLCVDGYTELLDPTAGSGSALRAAASMGAKRVVGLELNPEYAESAQREFDQQMALESLRSKG